ncbi:MAG: EAL domain-containing protein [Sulfuricella sp.]|nr:EAL domain-containing protein [Sulfuricella sp.]
METVLLVDVDQDTAAALRRDLNAAHPLLETDGARAMIQVQELRQALGTVVLGAKMEAPLAVAQQIHAVDRDWVVFILRQPHRLAEMQRVLRFTPLGGEVVCRSVEDRQSLAEELVSAMARARQRRGYRFSLADIEAQRQSIGHRPPRAQYLDRLLDSVPIGVVIADMQGVVTDWNRMAGAILEKRREDAIGSFLPALFPAGENDKLATLIANCTLPGQLLSTAELRRKRADGSLQCVETTVAPVSGDETEALIIFEDITERKCSAERQALAEKVFAHTSEAIMITDKDNRILSVNPAFTQITGYTATEAIGQNPRMLRSGRHDKAFYRQMWEALGTQGSWAGEIQDRRKNGEIYPKWLTINAVRDENTGWLSHYVAIFSDISDRKRSEERIHYLAYNDSLTGLPNRFALHVQLPHFFADAERKEKRVAVLFLDLDRFKAINDSLGHHVGDQLLIEAGRRIRQTVRESDMVARVGGDEFVVILPDIANPAWVAAIAAKIVAAFNQPVIVGGNSLYTSCSIGIGIFPDDGEDADTVLKNADTAMYHAKSQGRGNYQFFSNEMNLAATERLVLENRLRQALERNELELDYQPLMDIGSGMPVGVEALARWRPAGQAPIPPAKFIQVAQESGLIRALGEWVLEKACREMKRWLDLGLPPLRLAVNLSAHQLRDSKFPDRVADILRESGIEPRLLELELTECAVMARPKEAIEILGRLKAMGVALAIDDFGTGYSSLVYLKLLPIGRLKIDLSFIAGIESSRDDAIISASAIALGHSLGLKIVAEGVESAAQLEWLRRQGCDEAQGSYWSSPLPAGEVAEFVRLKSSPEYDMAPLPQAGEGLG